MMSLVGNPQVNSLGLNGTGMYNVNSKPNVSEQLLISFIDNQERPRFQFCGYRHKINAKFVAGYIHRLKQKVQSPEQKFD